MKKKLNRIVRSFQGIGGNNMKKALIIATIYPFINGFEKNNIKILQELGYEVHTIASGNDMTPNLDELNVKKNIINITRNPISIANIKAYFFIKKYINNNEIDLVHCHTPVGGVLGRLCNQKRRKKGKSKTIYTAHGFHFYKGAPLLNWLVYYPVEKWLSRYTDVLITINTEDYNRAKEKFKMKQLEYVPGVGIDLSKFQLKNFDRKTYRKELGVKSDDFAILSVGELNKNKNHEIVLRSIAKINNPKIKYMIAGQGDLDGYLIELANHLGIGDKVNLLGFRKDIPELLNSSDLYILPSLREGLNVSLLEAMASGLPCIGSKIRGNADLKDVCLFKVNDEEDLVSKINSVYQGRKGISNNSELEKFSNEAINHQLSRIYMKLMY